MSRERILFVTGRLAERSLRRVVGELAPRLGFDYEVAVLGISVAALMHCDWVARKLTIDGRFDRVILPGWCQGEVAVLSGRFNVPFERGPKNVFDLPQFLGSADRVSPDLSRYDIEIIAEINHAPRLSDGEILAAAEAYRRSGADVIDLGCVAGESWSRAGEVTRLLRREGVRVSIDSFDRREVEAAVEGGAELVLSCNRDNLAWAAGLKAELVAIPDAPHDLASLTRTVETLLERGARFRVDPILEPIGFGFAASLARYFEVRRRWPGVEMMMGIGNVTELTEADTAGMNVLLAGLCQELGIRSVLTTEVINWARTAVREFDLARRLTHFSLANKVLPKHLDPQLVMLRDPKIAELGEEELAALAAQLRDPNFRIFVERGEIHVMNRDGWWRGVDPYALFDQMAAGTATLDSAHAFYLGYELSKAMTALTLGKQYTQDESLRWGFLTVPETSAIERRKAESSDPKAGGLRPKARGLRPQAGGLRPAGTPLVVQASRLPIAAGTAAPQSPLVAQASRLPTAAGTAAPQSPLVEELLPAPDVADALRAVSHLPDVLLLESALQRDRIGRYSFLTADPFAFFEIQRAECGTDPFAELRDRIAGFPAQQIPGLPPFQGGAAGLLSYELGHAWERLPGAGRDEFQLPALAVGLYDWVIAWDHATGRAWIVSHGFPKMKASERTDRAASRSAEIRELLNRSHLRKAMQSRPVARTRRLAVSQLAPQSPVPGPQGLTSNFSRDGYLRAVERVIEYIYAGDVFQANLSQRLLFPQRVDPLELYERVRLRNPAPLAGYFAHGDWAIVSASPERFVALQNGEVETRPIKGTRQRRSGPEADLFTRDELRQSGKDQAENVMIVDLLRNDLSRVCRPGSIAVPSLCHVETYETVQHLVSEVRGRLEEGRDVWDLLRATFPGGSITGAPKVRAMEIIAELEPTARGPYCGSLFYAGFDGTADSNILIRTFTCRRGWIQCPVGGGIVAQSDPVAEYEETMHKADGMLRALE